MRYLKKLRVSGASLFKVLIFICLTCVFACKDEVSTEPTQPVEPVDSNPVTVIGDIQVETLVSGYSIPWGIEVIGEEEFLFTDRIGELYHFLEGTTTRVRDVPSSTTFTTSSGLLMAGLMDVSLHPDYNNNGWVYIAHVTSDNLLTVSRFIIAEGNATQVQTLFKANGISVGSRICWQDPSHFFLSVGVGGDPFPILGPQNLSDDRGKIHRLTQEGQIPEDNPVLPGQSLPTSIWTYGHRNPQGLFFDQTAQILYANEHGPFGGDELNRIEKGVNYGWPLFSHGLNYDGSQVSTMSESEAAEISILPMKFWDHFARVSPSGLLFLEESQFIEWNGSFLMGSLYPQNLLRYDPETDQTEIVLEQIGRVRDVAMLPSGNIIILLDAGSPGVFDMGRVLKLSPTE